MLCLAVSSDGGRLLSGSEDNTIRLWKLEGTGEPLSLAGHAGAVTGIAFAAEDRQALSWSRDHTLRFWDLDKGRELRRRSGDDGCHNSCCTDRHTQGHDVYDAAPAGRLWSRVAHRPRYP